MAAEDQEQVSFRVSSCSYGLTLAMVFIRPTLYPASIQMMRPTIGRRRSTAIATVLLPIRPTRSQVGNAGISFMKNQMEPALR